MTKYPKAAKHFELKPEELRWKCNPEIFDFISTEELEPLEGILGQERAIRALKLGVGLRSPGYNIYIAGLSGTGKATTVKQMLEKISTNCPDLYDYVYVNNFKDEDRPKLLTFPVGKAKQFKKGMAKTIELLKKKIPQTLEEEGHLNRLSKLTTSYAEKEEAIMAGFEAKIKQDEFALGQIKMGEVQRTDVLPVVDNKPIAIFQLEEQVAQGKLTEAKATDFAKKYAAYQHELKLLMKKTVKVSEEYNEKIKKLERETVEAVVKGAFDSLRDDYTDKKVLDYLEQAENSVLDSIHIFKGAKPDGEQTAEGMIIDYFQEYEVNVILDNSGVKNSPVIVETSPNHANVFGTIEKINDGRGGWYSDFTKIKAGCLLRANGGYLVINVNHLFEEPGVWRTLKRVLIYHQLEIQDQFNYFQASPSMLKPEPISIDAKVILIGSQNIYTLLSEHEYDFKKIFKVKADFDYEISRSDEVLIQYARVIKKLITQENLLEFNKSAIAYLIELSARYAGRKDKLTTRFSRIADIAREATFWAKDEKKKVVSAKHVEKAYLMAKERHGLLEDKVTEQFIDETILIDTEGERLGQINGLAVYGSDIYAFGRPTRITSTISLGGGSIINVEREAGMSGRHYNKGVLIISGYFRETFGQDHPLSFNANLVFEQSYGTVDGDSASCAEIFALLSTLSGLPIKQSIAVTGSLNQKGDVQPIGGVNEKIEGFYDVCKLRGFNKRQGVIIPVQNVKELMLRDDILKSVKKGEFHIYPISRVEEGIEILTGTKAGDPNKRPYEENTVFDLVEKKIKDLYARSKAVRPVSPETGINKDEKHKTKQRSKPSTNRKKKK